MGDETLGIGVETCKICLIEFDTPTTGQLTIRTRAEFKKAFTNLKVVVDSTTLKNVSGIPWEELATPLTSPACSL